MKTTRYTTLLAVALICLFAYGCDNSEEIAKKAEFKKELQVCIDVGGVPIRSAWNNERLGECIFVPK